MVLKYILSNSLLLLPLLILLQFLFALRGLSQPTNCSTCGNTLEMRDGVYQCRYCNPESFGAVGFSSRPVLSEQALVSVGLLYSCMYQLLPTELKAEFSENVKGENPDVISLKGDSYKIKEEISENIEFLNILDFSDGDDSAGSDTFVSLIQDILNAMDGFESDTNSIHSELAQNAEELNTGKYCSNLMCVSEFNSGTSEADFNNLFSAFQDHESGYITVVGKNSTQIITLPVIISTAGYNIITGGKTFNFTQVSFYQLLMDFLKKLKRVVGRKKIKRFYVYIKDKNI